MWTALPRILALPVLVAAAAGCAAAPATPVGVPPATAVDVGPPAVAAVVHVPQADGSDVVASSSPARNAVDAPGALAFVETVGDHGWVVLAEADDDVVHGAPVPRSDPRAGFTALEAKVRPGALSRDLRLEGRRFDLYDRDVRLCTVTAGAPRVLGVTATPFDVLEDPDRTAPPTADDLWTYTRRFVALPIDLPAACRTATWARLTELPPPRFARPEGVAAKDAADRAAQFRAAPAWREVQQRFDEARSSGVTSAVSATWDEAGALVETTWSAPFTAARWTVRQAVWDEGCGASGSLTLAWRQSGDGAELVHAAEDRFDVEVVLDLDADGALEMIGTSWGARELRRFFGAGEEPILGYEVPEHGCPC